MTTDTDDGDRRIDEQPRNLMREHNPDTWDPEPPSEPSGEYSHRGVPTVNTWDPVAGHAVNVPGHRADRDPDMDGDHARRLALRGEFDDLDDDQPLPLLASSMRTVPVEGTQGSFSRVIRLDDPCPGCGGDWGVHKCASTLGGVHMEICLLCEYEISPP